MIIQENIELNGKKYIHTYSDLNFYIQKKGTEEIYEETYDVPESTFIYIETSQKIENDEKMKLKLTRGDVFRGIYQAKGITREEIRALIEAMPEETKEEIDLKELASIDFDEALYFYRGNSLISKLGVQLGIAEDKMTRFFATNDWHVLA